MRLREKTTATLLAAIFITMAGVMPALAYDTEVTVPLTVEVLELPISITVTGSGAFGSVVQGQSISLSAPLILTITSPNFVTVEAELIEIEDPYDVITSGLFYDHMMVQLDTLDPTTFDAFMINVEILPIAVYEILATINVPIDYTVGPEAATLVFWIRS